MKLGTYIVVTEPCAKEFEVLGKVVGKEDTVNSSYQMFVIATPRGKELMVVRLSLRELDEEKDKDKLKLLREQEEEAIRNGILPLYGRNLVLDEGSYPDDYME